MKPKKKSPPYARRKRAFDEVLAAYRDSQIAPLSAIQYGEKGTATRYAAKPTLTDFKCDVERVIKKCIKEPRVFGLFVLAYVCYDSDDVIEREVYADKVIGEGRHNLEQGLGAEFIKRKIYPTRGKGGYFTAIRKQPRRNDAK